MVLGSPGSGSDTGTMKQSRDHLPQGKRRELEFVVEVIREGFAKALVHRTQPRLPLGRLLKSS